MGPESSPPTPAERAAVLVVSVLGCAATAVALGAETSGDLLNYHFYNGYALLAGRLDQDLAPAGHASYFNPLLDAVHYLGISRLTPMVFTALLGALQGLNVVLVWAIARHLLGPQGRWLAPLAALVAATGQNAASLLGTTFGDNTVSIPALAGVLALVGAERPGRPRTFLAGAAGGAAVGLKLTMAVPFVGIAVLAGWTAWRLRQPALLVVFGLGSLAGWGLTGGWWAVEMGQRFGNPFFPMLNGLFDSPYGLPSSPRDVRWGVVHLVDWLRPPVDAALGAHHRLQEMPFRDPRLLAVFLVLPAWLLARLARVRAGQSTGAPGRGLVPCWLATYACWVGVLYYYRYATVLELLAPVVVFVLLRDAWPRRLTTLAPALAVGVLLATSVGLWWRIPNRAFWFRADLPALSQEPGQLILLPEIKTSFVVPFFPPDAAFVGLAYRRYYGPALHDAIVARIDAHDGPLRVLVSKAGNAGDLSPWGLVLDRGACDWVRFGLGSRYILCPLLRQGPAQADSSTTGSGQ